MAAAGLPLLKLSALLVKTISKPVGAFFKAQSQKEKRVADFFIGVGQRMHYVQSRINVIASGYKFVGVKPLASDQALNDGAGTMSELLVLSISATLVIYEYQRSAAKDKLKNELLAAEKAHQRYLIESRFQGIETRLEHIEQLLAKAASHGPELGDGANANGSSSHSKNSGTPWWNVGSFLIAGWGGQRVGNEGTHRSDVAAGKRSESHADQTHISDSAAPPSVEKETP